jgi:hypothetical protein
MTLTPPRLDGLRNRSAEIVCAAEFDSVRTVRLA